MIKSSRICSNNLFTLIPSLLSLLSPRRAVHGFHVSPSGVRPLLPAQNLSYFSSQALYSTKEDNSMSSPTTRRSTRNKTTTPKRKKGEEETSTDPTLASATVTDSVSSSSSVGEGSTKKEEPTPKRKKVVSKTESKKAPKEKKAKANKTAKIEPQRITERDELEKPWNGSDGSYSKSYYQYLLAFNLAFI